MHQSCWDSPKSYGFTKVVRIHQSRTDSPKSYGFTEVVRIHQSRTDSPKPYGFTKAVRLHQSRKGLPIISSCSDSPKPYRLAKDRKVPQINQRRMDLPKIRPDLCAILFLFLWPWGAWEFVIQVCTTNCASLEYKPPWPQWRREPHLHKNNSYGQRREVFHPLLHFQMCLPVFV